MSINQRIKELRGELGFSQKEFGEKIGLKKSAASWIEKEGSSVIDQNIRLICDTFHINEKWLRTGDGNMYAPDSPGDIFDSLRDELNLSDIEEKILRGYFELDERSRKSVTDFIVNIGRTVDKAVSTHVDEDTADISQSDDDLELKKRQDIIAAEFAAEKKGRMSTASTSINGHAKKA